jgi:hypothetical protein
MFLHQKEHENWWNGRNDATSAHHMVGSAILTVEGGNACRNGLCVRPLCQDNGPEIIIPNERKD